MARCGEPTQSGYIRTLGILAPAMFFFINFLVVFTGFRLALCVDFYATIKDVDNFLHVLPVGLRMDTVMLCYVLAVPVIALVCLPASAVRKSRFVFALYFSVLTAVFVFLEMATFSYMDEFSARPDRIFLANMLAGPEIAFMIAKGYPLMLAASLAVTAAMTWLVFKKSARGCSSLPAPGFIPRLLLAVTVVPLLFIGMRSSLTHRPVNISDAAFSMNHLVNQLGINSTYSLGYAFYQSVKHEEDPALKYGKMPDDEILRRVKALNGVALDNSAPGNSPLLHYQRSGFERSRPLNLVIIMQESLGAEYVGCLGGLPLTPNLDRLSREGLLFTNLYSTGTRTVRGIEAVISGFLPTPGESVVKLPKSRTDFFTIAELLRREGYHTEFVYGGKSTWDNMQAFFAGNGFTDIHDQDEYINPVFEGSWGVSDEDLFNKTHELLLSHGDRPFFTLVLTTTNHDPFEFPAGRIEPYEQRAESRYNAIKYADYAMGRFFEKAKSAPYHDNTLFLVVADHSTRLRGQELIPIEKFHIPALIIAPGVKPGTYDQVASQIDLPATILDIMGINCEHPMIGRPLLSMAQDFPGRAVMQYGETHAYLVGDRMTVHRPKIDARQFIVTDGSRLVSVGPDPEMEQDALAYALLPGMLYGNKIYRLPEVRE